MGYTDRDSANRAVDLLKSKLTLEGPLPPEETTEQVVNRVQTSLRALEDEIETTHRLLEVLEDRLGPVLGFAVKEEEDSPGEKSTYPNGSPLGNRLDFQTESMVLANYRIRSMLDRLEV